MAILIKDQNANGAPKKTLLERMKTKAWLSFIFESKNTREINDLNKLVFSGYGDVPIYRLQASGDIPEIRWKDYQIGSANPNEVVLKRVTQERHVPGSLAVFETGLYEENKIVPIWRIFEFKSDALSHESKELWAMVDAICGDMHDMRSRGAPYLVRFNTVAQLLIPKSEWGNLHFSKPESHPKINAVVTAYRNGYFIPSLKLLGGIMAMWRIAIDVGESMAQMEYLVKGLLLCEPCVQILKSHDIYEEFLSAVNIIEIKDCIQREDFETAKKIAANLLGERK